MTTAVLSGRTFVTLVDIPEPPLPAVPSWGRVDRSIRHRGTEPRASHCHDVTPSGAAGALGPPVPPCPNQRYPHFSHWLPGTVRAHGTQLQGAHTEHRGPQVPRCLQLHWVQGSPLVWVQRSLRDAGKMLSPAGLWVGGSDGGRGSVTPVMVNGPWPLSDTPAARSWRESGHWWVSSRPPPYSHAWTCPAVLGRCARRSPDRAGTL